MGLRNVDLEDASPSIPSSPRFHSLPFSRCFSFFSHSYLSLSLFFSSPLFKIRRYTARDFSNREKKKKIRKQKSLEQIFKKISRIKSFNISSRHRFHIGNRLDDLKSSIER